jgi:hypothetical protein
VLYNNNEGKGSFNQMKNAHVYHKREIMKFLFNFLFLKNEKKFGISSRATANRKSKKK